MIVRTRIRYKDVVNHTLGFVNMYWRFGKIINGILEWLVSIVNRPSIKREISRVTPPSQLGSGVKDGPYDRGSINVTTPKRQINIHY